MSTIMKNLLELTEKNLDLTDENEKLKKEVVFHMKAVVEAERKLEEAKEWLIEIYENNENRSEFGDYMKKVWNYERS